MCHSVHPPPSAGGVGLGLQPNLQKGGSWRDCFLEGVAGKEGAGVNFLRGQGFSFSTKNKLKSRMVNDKNSL